MSTLYEICSQKNCIEHTPLTQFGKKYYRTCDGTIFCEECLKIYKEDVVNTIVSAILNVKDHIDIPTIHENLNRVMLSASNRIRTHFKYKMGNHFPNSAVLTITSYSEQTTNEDNDKLNDYGCTIIDFGTMRFGTDLYTRDNKFSLTNLVTAYIDQYMDMNLTLIPDNEVQMLMDAAASGDFNSGDCNGQLDATCVICGATCSSEYYIINNVIYCLDCMYEYVVKSAVMQNLSEQVGIAVENPPCDSNVFNIYNTKDWKRTVIGKYILTMKSLGFDPGICHFTTNLSCN